VVFQYYRFFFYIHVVFQYYRFFIYQDNTCNSYYLFQKNINRMILYIEEFEKMLKK